MAWLFGSVGWPSIAQSQAGLSARARVRFVATKLQTGSLAMPPGASLVLVRESPRFEQVSVPFGEVVAVPRGSWEWRAEAPGWAAVGKGELAVAGAGVVEVPVHWQASCTIDLLPSDSWAGVTSIEVIAGASQSAFRVDAAAGGAIVVPAGPVGLIVTKQGSLPSLVDAFECSASSRIARSAPGPTPRDGQDLVFRLTAPQAAWEATSPLLLATRHAGSPRATLPTLVATAGWRRSQYLAIVREGTDRGIEWLLRHPDLRPITESLAPRLGEARAVERELRPKQRLEITVNYQPKIPHKLQRLVLLRCGARPIDGGPFLDAFGTQRCEQAGNAQELRVGRATYEWRGLDPGQYLVNAEIDDELVYGLGSWYTPFLDRDGEELVKGGTFGLVEHRIRGHILDAGVPVAGEVRLDWSGLPSGRPRTFRTGPGLEYELTYFGTRPAFASWSRPLVELGWVGANERHGLYFDWSLSACPESGACRTYPTDSVLVGDGRLDLDVGAGPDVRVRVVDAATGKPIPGAWVTPGEIGKSIVFLDGRSDLVDGHLGNRSAIQRADLEGTVWLRAPRAGSLPFVVGRPPDYEVKRVVAEVHATTTLELEVAIRRQEGDAQSAVLVLPDNSAVRNAALLAYSAGSGELPSCVLTTDGSGRVVRARSCPRLDSSEVVVLAHGAEISVVEGRRLVNGGRIEVNRAPRPFTLRFVTPTGEGRSFDIRRFAVRTTGPVLSADAIVLGGTESSFVPIASGLVPGDVEIHGLNPWSVNGPELLYRIGDDWETLQLPERPRSGPVEVVVPDE